MTSSGFPINLSLPDLWQLEAVRHIRSGSDVVVDAPTGAGKTHIFELLVEAGLRGQAVFTVPTRALANDKRLEWQRKGWKVGSAEVFLGLSPEESRFIELKLTLSHWLRERRVSRKLSQTELADRKSVV